MNSEYKFRIFEAAKELIGNGGKDFLTISNIVKSCNISKRTFYEIFSSKSDFVIELNKILDSSLQIKSEKEVIIEKARENFVRYGYKSIDIDTIAAAAGTNRSKVYKYFETKEKLFEYCVRYELELIKQYAGQILSDTENPFAALNEYIKNYCIYVSSSYGHSLFVEMHSQASYNEDLKGYMKEFKYFFINKYKDILKAGMEQGIFREDMDVEGTAILLQIILSGVLLFSEIDCSIDISGNIRDNILSVMHNTILKKLDNYVD